MTIGCLLGCNQASIPGVGSRHGEHPHEVGLALLCWIVQQVGHLFGLAGCQVGQVHVVEFLGHGCRDDARLNQRLQSKPLGCFVASFGNVPVQLVNHGWEELADPHVVTDSPQWLDGAEDSVMQLSQWPGTVYRWAGQGVGLPGMVRHVE
jgi:hypothetical protein